MAMTKNTDNQEVNNERDAVIYDTAMKGIMAEEGNSLEELPAEGELIKESDAEKQPIKDSPAEETVAKSVESMSDEDKAEKAVDAGQLALEAENPSDDPAESEVAPPDFEQDQVPSQVDHIDPEDIRADHEGEDRDDEYHEEYDDEDEYDDDDDYYEHRPLWKRFFGGIWKILRNLIILVLVLAVLITTFTFFSVFMGTLNHPVKYDDLIEEAAEKYSLSPYLVAGVIKVESSYKEKAVSPVGARGLMQLMPETAQWCAGQMGVEYKPEFLDDAAYNIDMGCFYLSYLVQHFQNYDLAIAAYNTGSKNVDQWIEEGLVNWDKDSLKSIPYQETREYVKKVSRAEEVYRVFYGEGLSEAAGDNHFGLALDNFIDLIRWTVDRAKLRETESGK